MRHQDLTHHSPMASLLLTPLPIICACFIHMLSRQVQYEEEEDDEGQRLLLHGHMEDD